MFQPKNDRSSTNAFHFWPSIRRLLSENARSFVIVGSSANRYGIMRYSYAL